MRKFSRGAISTTVGSGVLLTATALPAHAVDFVSDSIAGLIGKNVVIDSSASLSNASDISSAYSGSSVGVVSLPPLATSTFSASNLASQILNGTSGQYDTIIVVVDSSFGVASNGDSALIVKTLNEANTGDAGAAILASASTITAATTSGSTNTSTQAESSPPAGNDVVLYGGTSVAVAVVLALSVVMLRKNKKGDKHKVSSTNFKERLALLPDDLRKVANEFVDVVRAHEAADNNSTLAPDLKKIVTNFTELFARIDRKGTEQQARMASIQYIDTFTKLNLALGRDYYLDIRSHPDLWDNVPQRLKEVETAVSATSDELINNIRQINASKDLEFQVALESLSKSINDISVGDLYKDKNS